MDIMQLNWFDYGVLAFVALSALVGLKRGFIRETIALISWLTAFVVAIVFSDVLAAHLIEYVKTETIAMVLSFVLLFLVPLILGGIVNFLIALFSTNTGTINIVNHLFGFLFGAIRGLIISLFAIFLLVNTPVSELAWFTNSQTANVFKTPTDLIKSHVLPSLAQMSDEAAKNGDHVIESSLNTTEIQPQQQPTFDQEQSAPITVDEKLDESAPLNSGDLTEMPSISSAMTAPSATAPVNHDEKISDMPTSDDDMWN